MRRLVVLLSGFFFGAFLLGLSPHLVHHLFEDHQDHERVSGDACPFATVLEREHPDAPGEVVVRPGPDVVAAVAWLATAPPPRMPVARNPGRGPPRSAS
jgi:hypothetical protein